MSDDIDESVRKADRWSRVIGLFVALGVYFGALQLTADVPTSMLVAAVTAIGARIYIPYHASLRVTEGPGTDLAEIELTGDYHYGAVGLALIVGPLVTVAVRMVTPESILTLGAGGLAAAVTFVVVRAVLPE